MCGDICVQINQICYYIKSTINDMIKKEMLPFNKNTDINSVAGITVSKTRLTSCHIPSCLCNPFSLRTREILTLGQRLSASDTAPKKAPFSVRTERTGQSGSGAVR